MEKEQFDALDYFAQLGRMNRLARQMGFVVDYCSGPGALEPMMAEYRDAQNFIFVDDTTSGNTFSNKVGWFDKNVYKVFILAGYEFGNAEREGFIRRYSGIRKDGREYCIRVFYLPIVERVYWYETLIYIG